MPESRPAPDQPTDRANDPGNHRYDSFVLRLWTRGDPTTFHRVEVRHVQSETVTTATNVTLEWIRMELASVLGRGDGDLRPGSGR